MKRRDLERELARLGWWEVKGTKHAKWTNGSKVVTVPRHSEVNEWTARSILRFVAQNPGEKNEISH